MSAEQDLRHMTAAAPVPFCQRCQANGGKRCGLCSYESTLPPRPEAEQRVLDACAGLDLSEVKLDEDGLTAGEVESIVDAELARRGLK